MMDKPRWETDPPDYINELGNKWWTHSMYKAHQIWVMQFPEGDYIFVAVHGDIPVCEDVGLESLCVKIDCAVMIATGDRKEKERDN